MGKLYTKTWNEWKMTNFEYGDKRYLLLFVNFLPWRIVLIAPPNSMKIVLSWKMFHRIHIETLLTNENVIHILALIVRRIFKNWKTRLNDKMYYLYDDVSAFLFMFQFVLLVWRPVPNAALILFAQSALLQKSLMAAPVQVNPHHVFDSKTVFRIVLVCLLANSIIAKKTVMTHILYRYTLFGFRCSTIYLGYKIKHRNYTSFVESCLHRTDWLF